MTTDEHQKRTDPDDLPDGSPSGDAESHGDEDTASGGDPED